MALFSKQRKNKENRKIKWLVYTVFVGLIPVFSRLFACLVTKQGTVNLLNASDFISFGLVLHISNINEIEHISNDSSWKTVQNGTSIVFISFYTLLFSLNLVGESVLIIDKNMINTCSVALSLVSFLISYSVYDRIARVSEFKKYKS